MKPIEINPVARTLPTATPAGSNASRALAGAASSAFSGPAASPTAEPEMVTRSDALSAGKVPPVNSDRVTQIRQAVQDGSYPLVPASVADAMIAASFILIEGKRDQ